MKYLLTIFLATRLPLTIGLGLSLLTLYDYIFLFTLPIIIFCLLDIKSRLNEFSHVRNFVKKGGDPKRLVKIYRHSRCQRDAFIFALYGTKFYSECKLELNKLGYKWYHITPDWFMKNPTYIFTTNFWRTFFK